MTSRSTPDSAPHASPARPSICRTFALPRFDGKLSNYDGKTIGMFLPIRIRGVAKNYQFTFRVEKDLAATGRRAKERELATAQRAKEREIRSDELIRSLITKKEFSNKWPFTIDEGVLACGRRAVFLLVGGTVYALNGTAAGMTVDGKAVSNDLSAIQTDKAKAFDTSVMITLRNMGRIGRASCRERVLTDV